MEPVVGAWMRAFTVGDLRLGKTVRAACRLGRQLNVWPQVMVTLTVAVLMVSALAAVCRKSSFAVGFSIIGWMYFLLIEFSQRAWPLADRHGGESAVQDNS